MFFFHLDFLGIAVQKVNLNRCFLGDDGFCLSSWMLTKRVCCGSLIFAFLVFLRCHLVIEIHAWIEAMERFMDRLFLV